MAPFFKLEEAQQREYRKVNREVMKELDFWVLHNDRYILDDRAYWSLLARYDDYMERPAPGSLRKLKSTIESFQDLGADGDWLWEIHDFVIEFQQTRLWPWLLELWKKIIVQDFESIEKVLRNTQT